METIRKTLFLNRTTQNFFLLDYGNGFTCEYTLVDGKFHYYSFHYNNRKKGLKYCDNIEKYINNHWSDNDYNTLPSLTLEQINNFNEFDKLYSFNENIKTYDGREISTPFIISDIDSQIYLDIETTKEECHTILSQLKYGELLDSGIYDIPHYNQNENKYEHYTIYFTVKLTQEVFDEIKKLKCQPIRSIFHYMKTGEIKEIF